MMETPAWLMEIGGGRVVAAGERELLHLVEQPELFEVPLAPRHCRHVLAWQGQLLPVWNVQAWMERGAMTEGVPLVVIIGYQLRRGEFPRFGAVMLAEPPRRTRVSDSQACPLPAELPGLNNIALSCFEHDGQPVPVLDLRRMFSRHIAPALERPAAPRSAARLAMLYA